MDRVFNFASGPAMLPLDVLEKAKYELLNYNNTGMSIMEMPYNSKEFKEIMESLEETVRELLEIPNNYKLLFLRGGAVEQYAAIPLNMFSERKCADYIVTGEQSRAAYLEAKKYGDAVIAASSGGSTPVYNSIPETSRATFRPDVDYVYMRYANTAMGTKFNYVPDTGNIPLVADLSSCFLSEPLQVSAFGLVYADMRRCLLPAGMTVVLVRADLIGNARPQTPTTLDYRRLLEEGCTYHAPSPVCLFAANRLFHRMLSAGGLEEMKRRGERKASLLYDYLDGQAYYTAPADKAFRSMTSVVFTTGNSAMDERFAEAAEAEGLLRLRLKNAAHGLCASLHFAIPYEGVECLVSFMKKFALENPKLSI